MELDEVLLRVEDDFFEGVTISLNPIAAAGQNKASQLTIPNSHLSGECGQDMFRCQDLVTRHFTTADKLEHRLVYLPLQGGLALVDVMQDTATQLHMEYTILHTSSAVRYACSPSTVHIIQNNYLAVCTNQSTNFVAVLDIRANETSLHDSTFVPTSTVTVPPSIGNISDASNYQHIEIDRSHEYIVFAVGRAMFSLQPFIYSVNRMGDIPRRWCDTVTRLVPLKGAVFYVYCTDHLFTYDIGEEDWLTWDTFSRIGIPHLCPQAHTNLSIFSSYISILSTDTDGTVTEDIVELETSAYSSGVCFGNATQSYFALSDRSAGVSVLDLMASSVTSNVSGSACRQVCYPLLAVENRYLLVRDTAGEKVWVLDFFGPELRREPVAAHTTPQLVSLLLFEQHNQDPIVPPKKNQLNPGVIIGPIAGVFVVIVLIAVAIALTVLHHPRRPIIRSVEEENQSKFISMPA